MQAAATKKAPAKSKAAAATKKTAPKAKATTTTKRAAPSKAKAKPAAGAKGATTKRQRTSKKW